MRNVLMVTGASSDVGTSLIQKVAANYEKIVAHYCHWNTQMESLKQELGEKIVFLQADFSDADSVQNMITAIQEQGLEPNHMVHFPAPKILAKKFCKTTWSDFDSGWEISLHSLFTILQTFLPHMAKQKYGKIIVMLTVCTWDKPPKYQACYTTVKYALLGMIKSLAIEYEGKGITFNGISPDMIQTKFLADLPELMIEQYASNRPAKQILTVKEVLPVFEFLLSEGANQINGENLRIQ